MTISSLSEATARVLTSTQALNTATSVVKELVDNALDAHATSIAIEITGNTLDKISVKDDGSGIGVEDRLLLCKRGYTSKITDLEDLAKLGGTFLGFRGTALASIAELSKNVTIITKVDGEQPATTLTFGPSGRLLSSASASHNVGTTVRIDDFLATVPVRRQAVLKNPTKAQDQIKKLLQSYALARPSVKLSLRILKAKTERANWSYAASRGEFQLVAAAAQIVGKPVVSSCKLHTTARTGGNTCATDFRIDALLLESGAEDISRGSGVGQYVSIDGRPVDPEKGVTKDLVRLYRSHLRYASGPNGSVPSKPFLVAHIHCPDQSYDVNIEPAKDIVLFHDESKVLDLAKQLFVKVYGESDVRDDTYQSSSVNGGEQRCTSSFDVLLARKKPGTTPGPTNHVVTASGELDTTSSRSESLVDSFARTMEQSPLSFSSRLTPKHKVIPDSLFTPDFSGLHQSLPVSDREFLLDTPKQLSGESLGEVEVYDPSDATLNNPFVRAKVHALQTPKKSPMLIDRELARRSNETGVSSRSSSQSMAQSSTIEEQTAQGSTSHLLSPDSSPIVSAPHQNPGPPVPRRPRRVRGSEDSRDDPDGSSPLARSAQHRQTLLRSWTKGSNSMDSPPGFQRASEISNQDVHVQERALPAERGIRVGKALQSNSHSPITNKPYRSPVKVRLDKTSGAAPSNPYSNLSPSLAGAASHTIDPDVSARHNADLHNILDFELRKRAVNQQRKLQQGGSSLSSSKSLARPQPSLGQFVPPSATAQSHPPNNIDGDSALFNPTPSFARPPDFSTKFNDALHHDDDQPSNPHRNRYLAAIRNLSSSGTIHSPPHPHVTGAGVINPQTHPHPSARKPKRVISSKLPLETITLDSLKYNILATPITLFPPIKSLLAQTQTLAEADPYIRTGSAEAIRLSPTDRDVMCWQVNLETLVTSQYRSNRDGDRDGNQIELPGFTISLAQALRSHLDTVTNGERA